MTREDFQLFRYHPRMGTRRLDLTGCPSQQGVLSDKNYATSCLFQTKIMGRGIIVDKKIMQRCYHEEKNSFATIDHVHFGKDFAQ